MVFDNECNVLTERQIQTEKLEEMNLIFESGKEEFDKRMVEEGFEPLAFQGRKYVYLYKKGDIVMGVKITPDGIHHGFLGYAQ